MQKTVPPASSALYRRRRIGALTAARKAAGGDLDALLITSPPNLRYLSGSTDGASALLIGKGRTVIFTNRMFEVRVTRETPGCTVRLPRGKQWEELAGILERRGVKSLGFEDNHLTVNWYQGIEAACAGIEFKGVGNAVLLCRSIKEEGEIELTRQAVVIAENAFEELIGRGAAWFVGRSEKEIAAELEYRMRLNGADRAGFATILASGPSSYNCHHVPTDRPAAWGEPLLFDWGAELDGYRSDITRTVFLGDPSDKLAEIYAVVHRAHDGAVDAMAPGVCAHTVDAVARRIIRNAGYAKEFRHGLGHSFGLEIHEPPNFGARPTRGRGTVLRRNLLITVEPGVYLLGLGGVRIEDDILVTADGRERLNRLPRDIESMTLR